MDCPLFQPAKQNIHLHIYWQENQSVLAISHSVMPRINCNILDFKDSVTFICDNTFCLHTAVVKNVHCAFFEIAVDHIFLLVCQQQKCEELLFIFIYFSDFHF